MATKELTSYSPVLVPALHRIQRPFGHLKAEALEEFSKESGVPQTPDLDVDQSFLVDDAMIDPYRGNSSDYRAVRAAITARDASLSAAKEFLSAKPEWTFGMLEKFRLAAIGQMRVDFEMEPAI